MQTGLDPLWIGDQPLHIVLSWEVILSLGRNNH